MTGPGPYHLFERVGVELEYMIVDAESLCVRPITDAVLRAVSGSAEADVTVGGLTWSNELVAHVVELKTAEPAGSLAGLPERFQDGVQRINAILQPLGARLMPTAAHPWMDPITESRLWSHDSNEVYQSFHRIFDCRGHGWSNLQAAHVNLPFADDEEFGRLHAAVRLVLPLLPALAASSPMLDGKPTGLLDSRMEVYRHNCRRVPSMTGRVIPEAVYHIAGYQAQILQRLYEDIAPHDPEAILREEWLNARGAIARFARNTIEIRVLDMQECPAADLAILTLVESVLRSLVSERWSPFVEQCRFELEPLEAILLATIREAERAVITDEGLRRVFGLPGASPCTAGELWHHLFETVRDGDPQQRARLMPVRTMLTRGPLARRILHALDADTRRERLAAVYGRLCDCLRDGCLFEGAC